MKKRLMSDMNPIKVADRDHRIVKRFADFFELRDNFHNKRKGF